MLKIIYPNRWFFWTIALIVFVGIALVGVIEKFQIDTETESLEISSQKVVKDETAGWKTYRNEELGFEFEYPSYLSPVVEKTNSWFFVGTTIVFDKLTFRISSRSDAAREDQLTIEYIPQCETRCKDNDEYTCNILGCPDVNDIHALKTWDEAKKQFVNADENKLCDVNSTFIRESECRYKTYNLLMKETYAYLCWEGCSTSKSYQTFIGDNKVSATIRLDLDSIEQFKNTERNNKKVEDLVKIVESLREI